MPVELRIVEEKSDALPVALIGELLEHVAMVRRAIYDVPIGAARVEHGEAVVMLTRDGDVAHPGRFRERDPLGGVELRRVEARSQRLVIGDRYLPYIHHPLAVTQHAIDAPVNEQPELRALKPTPRGQVCGRWFITILRVH